MSSVTVFHDHCIFCDQLIEQGNKFNGATTSTALVNVTYDNKQKSLYCSDACAGKDKMMKALENKSCCTQEDCDVTNNYYTHTQSTVVLGGNSQVGPGQMLSPASDSYHSVDSVADLQDDFFQLDHDHEHVHDHVHDHDQEGCATPKFMSKSPHQCCIDSRLFDTFINGRRASMSLLESRLMFDTVSSNSSNSHSLANSHDLHSLYIMQKPLLSKSSSFSLQPRGGCPMNDGICENNYKIWLNENHIG